MSSSLFVVVLAFIVVLYTSPFSSFSFILGSGGCISLSLSDHFFSALYYHLFFGTNEVLAKEPNEENIEQNFCSMRTLTENKVAKVPSPKKIKHKSQRKILFYFATIVCTDAVMKIPLTSQRRLYKRGYRSI